MNTLLLVVGIIFLLSVLIGYKKGFVKIAASLIAAVLCIVLVMFISPSVSQWIQESTPLRETIQEKCVKVIAPDGSTIEDALQIEVTREEQKSLIEDAELPDILGEKLWENNNPEIYTALGVESFVEYIGAYIAKVIADILAFLITFIVVYIVIRFVIGMLKIVDKIPLVGGANRTVGAVLGAVIGILIIWVLFIIITLLYNTQFGASCLANISENEILTWLYNNNILMNNIIKF